MLVLFDPMLDIVSDKTTCLGQDENEADPRDNGRSDTEVITKGADPLNFILQYHVHPRPKEIQHIRS